MTSYQPTQGGPARQPQDSPDLYRELRAHFEPRPTWDSATVIFDRIGVEWRAVEVA